MSVRPMREIDITPYSKAWREGAKKHQELREKLDALFERLQREQEPQDPCPLILQVRPSKSAWLFRVLGCRGALSQHQPQPSSARYRISGHLETTEAVISQHGASLSAQGDQPSVGANWIGLRSFLSRLLHTSKDITCKGEIVLTPEPEQEEAA